MCVQLLNWSLVLVESETIWTLNLLGSSFSSTSLHLVGCMNIMGILEDNPGEITGKN
jgi:hypothetical protein